MAKRKDLKELIEAYGGVNNVPLSPLSMLGGKPVMITMDMPGMEVSGGSKPEEDYVGAEGEIDHSEIEMACAELHKLEDYAPKLKEIIKQSDGLEGWVSSKITKAADYISSVYHWLEYQQHSDDSTNTCDHDHGMFNTGHEDIEHCQYASKGCKCGGCPECH